MTTMGLPCVCRSLWLVGREEGEAGEIGKSGDDYSKPAHSRLERVGMITSLGFRV